MYQNGHSLKLRSLLNEFILFHLRSISLNGILTGNDYLDLLCYATRLAFSSTVLTVGETPDGTLDPTDVMMFMKNAGAAADTCVQIKCSHSDITLNISKIVIVLTP